MSNKLILTGAGFSHNFGAPLAKQMGTLIFNEISEDNTLKRI